MSELRCLVYASSSTHDYTEEELEALLAGSRRNNAACGLTGVLLHASGNFLQLLEGAPAQVQATFDRIALDPRHGDIIVVLDEAVPAREFPGWAMALRPAHADELLEARTLGASGGGLGVLREMWRHQR